MCYKLNFVSPRTLVGLACCLDRAMGNTIQHQLLILEWSERSGIISVLEKSDLLLQLWHVTSLSASVLKTAFDQLHLRKKILTGKDCFINTM